VQNGTLSKGEGVEQGNRILEEHYEKQVSIINKFVEKKDLIGITGREALLKEALEEAKAAWEEIIIEASEAWKLKRVAIGVISFTTLTLAEQQKLVEPRKLEALKKIAEQQKREKELEALIKEALKKTEKSIPRRVDSLTQVFNHRIVNNSLKVIAPTNNAKWLKWVLHPELSKTGPCSKCRANAAGGRNGYYHVTWFTPKMPVHPNCLTPETEVNTSQGLIPIKDIKLGDYVLTHRGRYRRVIQLHRNPHEGKMYSLGGGWLTGNHPVLTPKGWVAIDSIEDGEQILSIAYHGTDHFEGQRDLTMCNLDSDKSPTTASEDVLLSSIESPLGFAIMPVTSINFDGDLQVRDGEVQVVNIESVLRNNGNPRGLEDIEESGFKGRHWTPKLPLKGSGNPLFSRGFTPSNGIMGGLDLGASLIGRPLIPQKLLRFTKTPNRDLRLNEATPDGSPGHPKVFSDFILGDSADIHLNDLPNGKLHLDEDTELISYTWHKPITLTSIDTDIYKKHVYNLSVDEDESYTIGKQRIIVHNCVCEWEIVFEKPDLGRDEVERSKQLLDDHQARYRPLIR